MWFGIIQISPKGPHHRHEEGGAPSWHGSRPIGSTVGYLDQGCRGKTRNGDRGAGLIGWWLDQTGFRDWSNHHRPSNHPIPRLVPGGDALLLLGYEWCVKTRHLAAPFTSVIRKIIQRVRLGMLRRHGEDGP